MMTLSCPGCGRPRLWYPPRKSEGVRFSVCGNCGLRVRLFTSDNAVEIESAPTETDEQGVLRKEFETELRTAIAQLIYVFEEKTSAVVRSIDVEMVDVTSLQGPPETLMGDVRVAVDWPGGGVS